VAILYREELLLTTNPAAKLNLPPYSIPTPTPTPTPAAPPPPDPSHPRVHPDVPQHHAAAEEQRRGVGQVLARDVGGGAVDRLHQGETVGAWGLGVGVGVGWGWGWGWLGLGVGLGGCGLAWVELGVERIEGVEFDG